MPNTVVTTWKAVVFRTASCMHKKGRFWSSILNQSLQECRRESAILIMPEIICIILKVGESLGMVIMEVVGGLRVECDLAGLFLTSCGPRMNCVFVPLSSPLSPTLLHYPIHSFYLAPGGSSCTLPQPLTSAPESSPFIKTGSPPASS